MYYNNFNSGYNPYQSTYNNLYGNQQQIQPIMQAQQPIMQTASVQQQSQTPINDFRFMTGDEIKAYVVNPNSRIFALDKDNMTFYIKATDSLGNTNMDIFDIIPKNSPKTAENSEKQLKVNYVTNDTFVEFEDAINNRIDSLEKAIKQKKSAETKEGAK